MKRVNYDTQKPLYEQNKKMCIGHSTEVEFILPQIDEKENRIVFAGLYPPGKSDPNRQHNNKTSIKIKNYFTNFDWIDIMFTCPEMAKNVNMYYLGKILDNDESYRTSWKQRVINRVRELRTHNHLPVVFVCGNICQNQWNKMFTNEICKDNLLQIYETELDGLTFQTLKAQHPSAHLQSHGEETSVQQFTANMQILKLLSKYGYSQSLQHELDTEELERRTIGFKLCTTLFGTENWPEKYRHLSTLQFGNEQVVNRLLVLINYTTSLLENHSLVLRLGNDVFWNKYKQLADMVNTTTVVRLLTNEQFCTKLEDPHFLDTLTDLISTLTQEHAIRLFSTASFCVRVLEDTFLDKLYHLVETLTQEYAIRLFSTESFCVRVLEDAFLQTHFLYEFLKIVF